MKYYVSGQIFDTEEEAKEFEKSQEEEARKAKEESEKLQNELKISKEHRDLAYKNYQLALKTCKAAKQAYIEADEEFNRMRLENTYDSLGLKWILDYLKEE